MPVAPARPWPPIHRLHALFLAWPVALFPAALIADIAYCNTAEMQWSNFAAWLIAGALLFGAIALLWAAIDVWRFRRHPSGARRTWLLLLLLAMWIAGLANALHHAGDGWVSVGPTGVLLSAFTSVLALAAGWLAWGRELPR